MRGEGLVIPGDSGREVCILGTSGFGAKAASKQVPCLRRAAPGAEGRARGGRLPGVGGWREPRAAGSRGSGGETRRRGGSGAAGAGPGVPPGSRGSGGLLLFFVSERSEFVTPVPPPPPPARW